MNPFRGVCNARSLYTGSVHKGLLLKIIVKKIKFKNRKISQINNMKLTQFAEGAHKPRETIALERNKMLVVFREVYARAAVFTKISAVSAIEIRISAQPTRVRTHVLY
jgi:hypothetical protein